MPRPKPKPKQKNDFRLFRSFDRMSQCCAHWFCCIILLGLQACSSGGPQRVEEPVDTGEKTYWSYSRQVTTENGTIALFDPFDLQHHEADPPDWYRYDYGIADDLTSGRFSAISTARNGQFRVRVTSSPLLASERPAAGPRATLRLRVLNHRLLLNGGDAWPSINQAASRYAYDERYLAIPNGDYRVTITALDPRLSPGHDFVFQLLAVDDPTKVKHAPAFPQLEIGKQPAVIGLNAPGFQINERCSEIPRKAEWTALTRTDLPIPGFRGSFDVHRKFYERGLARQQRGENAVIPLVLSQSTQPGDVGVVIAPANWSTYPIEAEVLCAVEITGADTSGDYLRLNIRPLSMGGQALTADVAHQLKNQFSAWSRYQSKPGWQFQVARAQRTRHHRSLVAGVMSQLNLAPNDAGNLLRLDPQTRAIRLIDRLQTGW